MPISESIRLESQSEDSLARGLFGEGSQLPCPEEEPGSLGFRLPADSCGVLQPGPRGRGEKHCLPVFSWHMAAFLPPETSLPHSPVVLRFPACPVGWQRV